MQYDKEHVDLVIQVSAIYLYHIQVPTCLVTQNSMYFPGKSNEIPC